MIVDEFTGRIMPGRRYSDGLHQAIEAKEHVKVKRESKTLATIETNAKIDYDIKNARLEQISDLYTEEAYLLCKRLEFKQLLGRHF